METTENTPTFNENVGMAQQPTTITPEMTKLEYGEEIKKMIHTAGTLELTEAQNLTLYADPNDDDIYIIPDGKIYMSWTKYAERLNRTFGGTGWALVPEGMPKSHNGNIYWPHHLIIKGVYIGTAIGEQQLSHNNMTYGEACEGAKSNALMRCCKNMGIGIKLWDKNFVNYWLSTYAKYEWKQDERSGRNKKIWSIKPNAFDSLIAKRNAIKNGATTQTTTQSTTTNNSVSGTNVSGNIIPKNENWDGALKSKQNNTTPPKQEAEDIVVYEEIKDEEVSKVASKKKKVAETKEVKEVKETKPAKETKSTIDQNQEMAANGMTKRVSDILADFDNLHTVEELKKYFDHLRQNRYDKEKFSPLEIEICRRAGNDRFVKLATPSK